MGKITRRHALARERLTGLSACELCRYRERGKNPADAFALCLHPHSGEAPTKCVGGEFCGEPEWVKTARCMCGPFNDWARWRQKED